MSMFVKQYNISAQTRKEILPWADVHISAENSRVDRCLVIFHVILQHETECPFLLDV